MCDDTRRSQTCQNDRVGVISKDFPPVYGMGSDVGGISDRGRERVYFAGLVIVGSSVFSE